MDKLQVFENSEFGKVRTYMESNGEITFCGADSAKALGYENTRKAIIDHCKEKGVTFHYTLTPGGNQKIKFISEGNLYRLITGSHLPSAERFESWIFDEVLPSIRKTGSYAMPNKPDPKIRQQEAEARIRNAKSRQANTYLKIAQTAKLAGAPDTYQMILCSHAAESLAGKMILPLPKSEEETYSATDVGKMAGVTAMRVGLIANQYELKTDAYGQWVWDKSRNSAKQVRSFRYNADGRDRVIGLVKELNL